MFYELKDRHPIAINFFEAAIKSNKLHHAYMLTGSDSMEQYYLAIQIAKILNCKNHSMPNCTCTNCSWINQNRHPAIITISPIDYTYGNDGAKASTVISINQARFLISSLATSSPYTRVIIFTDAVEGKEHERHAELVWKNYTEILNPPASSEKNDSDTNRLNWIPMPIKYETFNPAAPNTLLKTLEEPNPNVVFFFLTRDKEDMLDTIVSRCQVIPVPAKNKSKTDINIPDNFLSFFPPQNHAEAVSLSERLMEIAKQESYNLEELLNSLQEYLYRLIKDNHYDKEACAQLINFIERIERAKSELTSYVSPQAVIDSLFVSLIKN